MTLARLKGKIMASGGSHAYGKEASVVAVRFQFQHDRANTVALAGDFNGWDVTSHPMARTEGGLWTLELDLPLGRHEYKLFVDGCEWWNDPEAPKVPNDWGSENSYLDVAAQCAGSLRRSPWRCVDRRGDKAT